MTKTTSNDTDKWLNKAASFEVERPSLANAAFKKALKAEDISYPEDFNIYNKPDLPS